ncbi:coiled-coil domain-containing protein [Planoprotostelium fungivorum]|uniref:Coiled-coil domain-containing protein n=1 Tax=Planoprotostelium fungivorum TaxID=1890364 RepID=A0A2P6N9F8_9EUKA|nr:coiled-coil domain-containing protein [Planoprotostelium fungivorum]
MCASQVQLVSSVLKPLTKRKYDRDQSLIPLFSEQTLHEPILPSCRRRYKIQSVDRVRSQQARRFAEQQTIHITSAGNAVNPINNLGQKLALRDERRGDHIKALDRCSTQSEIADFLSLTFQLQKSDQKSVILLNLYTHLLMFCREKKLTAEKTSTLFSILLHVQEKSTTALHMDVEEAFEMFRNLIIKHSVHRPPFSVFIFTIRDIKIITEQLANTRRYFRHFKLYQYTFGKKHIINIRTQEIELETPPSIAPLSMASISLSGSIPPFSPDSNPQAPDAETAERS